MRHYLLLPLAAALGACAAPQPAPTTVASTDTATSVTCHQESVTGSGMIHTVCVKQQSEQERNALREDLRRMPPNNLIAHPAAGSP